MRRQELKMEESTTAAERTHQEKTLELIRNTWNYHAAAAALLARSAIVMVEDAD